MVAPALRHVVDLMNDRHQLIAAAHTVADAVQPSKSDELLSSHHADNFQVLSYDCFLQFFDAVSWVTRRASCCLRRFCVKKESHWDNQQSRLTRQMAIKNRTW